MFAIFEFGLPVLFNLELHNFKQIVVYRKKERSKMKSEEKGLVKNYISQTPELVLQNHLF